MPQAGQVPVAVGDPVGVVVEQREREVRGPGVGHPEPVHPVHPHQRIRQEGIGFGVDVVVPQHHVADVVHDHAADVVQRDPVQRHVVLVEAVGCGAGQRPGDDAGVGVPDALGHAGAARGEQLDDRIVRFGREKVGLC